MMSIKITNPFALIVATLQFGAFVYEFYHGRPQLAFMWLFVGSANVMLGMVP